MKQMMKRRKLEKEWKGGKPVTIANVNDEQTSERRLTLCSLASKE